jgi:type IV pilus assembly protein PilA
LNLRRGFEPTDFTLTRDRLDTGGVRPVDHTADDAARQNQKLAPAHSPTLVSDRGTLVPRRDFVQSALAIPRETSRRRPELELRYDSMLKGAPRLLVMARSHGGFTLMEMAVVLAIIGILALLAVPSYQDRVVRDQIISAMPLTDIAKAPVALSWATLQAFPADNASAGLPPAEKIVNNFISSVSVQAGAIHVTFGNSANGLIKGKILTLRPAAVLDAPAVPVAWVCGDAAGPGQMTIKGENKTNIPANYLPYNCRAPDR